jgi:death-on-curing protein
MDVMDAVSEDDLELAAHGGSSGIRDPGMLEPAMMRPRNLLVYAEQQPYLEALAAAYAFGISSDYPFVDGNKGTALLISFAFLQVNGVRVIASQEDAYLTILSLAAGAIDEPQLKDWFERNCDRS